LSAGARFFLEHHPGPKWLAYQKLAQGPGGEEALLLAGGEMVLEMAELFEAMKPGGARDFGAVMTAKGEGEIGIEDLVELLGALIEGTFSLQMLERYKLLALAEGALGS
jgi:hypothetical protein